MAALLFLPVWLVNPLSLGEQQCTVVEASLCGIVQSSVATAVPHIGLSCGRKLWAILLWAQSSDSILYVVCWLSALVYNGYHIGRFCRCYSEKEHSNVWCPPTYEHRYGTNVQCFMWTVIGCHCDRYALRLLEIYWRLLEITRLITKDY